jgi:hypothetical protein
MSCLNTFIPISSFLLLIPLSLVECVITVVYCDLSGCVNNFDSLILFNALGLLLSVWPIFFWKKFNYELKPFALNIIPAVLFCILGWIDITKFWDSFSLQLVILELVFLSWFTLIQLLMLIAIGIHFTKLYFVNNVISTWDSVVLEIAEDCVICHQEMKTGVKFPTCMHRFHGHCVSKWISNNPSCPICREKLEIVV